jgi:hypothetical protein
MLSVDSISLLRSDTRLGQATQDTTLAGTYWPKPVPVLFAFGISRIDPVSCRLEAVCIHVLQRLRVWFPLADELGAGGKCGPEAQ